MSGFLIKWLINAVALLLVVNMTSGAGVSDWTALIVAALVIGLLNAFLKPVLVIITLPINILSLGLFTLAINGFIFYLASKLVRGFYVTGFWGAMWAALLFSMISFLFNMITGGSKWEVRKQRVNTGRRGKVIDAEVVDIAESGNKQLPDGK